MLAATVRASPTQEQKGRLAQAAAGNTPGAIELHRSEEVANKQAQEQDATPQSLRASEAARLERMGAATLKPR